MSRIKRKDAELAAQLTNFEENFTAGFQTAAGITAAEMTAFGTQIGNFQNGLSSVTMSRASAKSAVQAKDAAKSVARATFQRFVDKIYASPSITDANLATFGLPPRSGPSISVPPIRVVDVNGEAFADGTAKIRWSRTGNPTTTLFLVQASIDGESFVQIGQTLRTSFKDIAATPGVPKSYRIVASNSLGQAAPSVAVTIYADGGEGELRLAS